jgi:hypothetical protein
MAKKLEKNIKDNKNIDPVPSATQVVPAKVAGAQPAKPREESHGGLFAATIALVALIIIGGGVLAFVIMIKAQNEYVDPIIELKPETEAPAAPTTSIIPTKPANSDSPLPPTVSGSTTPIGYDDMDIEPINPEKLN